MKGLKTFFYRVFQKVMYLAMFVLPWREPKIFDGDDSMGQLSNEIKSQNISKVLVVTDKGLMALNLLDNLFAKLKEKSIEYFIFDEVVPNPTIANIEAALAIYKENGCQGIIAFGGGSPMDCGKTVGARVVNPNKPVSKMKGLLKVGRKLPPFFAIPTTSGTGSETTLAAVVTDEVTHRKYAINDTHLIPHFAVLDPTLTLKLPKHITSTTGMDALCHAVEAYIGSANTKKTKQAAIDAVKLINQWLFVAYEDGSNLEARQHMQHASYLAGVAFTRAYVGCVHAMAHQLGGVYHVPHGLANAVIMPYVFRAYGKKAYKKLGELADIINISTTSDTTEIKAKKFIHWIETMNEKMAIPNKFKEIKEEDIDNLSAYAQAEANPLYPTPKVLFKEDFAKIYHELME
ncbi:MAG: iron-containing alcohol dehydrogenase [Clostridia bacterium]